MWMTSEFKDDSERVLFDVNSCLCTNRIDSDAKVRKFMKDR